MSTLISVPARITSAGNKPKLIDEYAGRARTGTGQASVAHMRSPGGWVDPGQQPDFDEITVVLRGSLRVEHRGGALDVQASQAVITKIRRVGSLQHSASRGHRIHRRLFARIFARHRAP